MIRRIRQALAARRRARALRSIRRNLVSIGMDVACLTDEQLFEHLAPTGSMMAASGIPTNRALDSAKRARQEGLSFRWLKSHPEVLARVRTAIAFREFVEGLDRE